MRMILIAVLLLVSACVGPKSGSKKADALPSEPGVIDHHTHIFSPEWAILIAERIGREEPVPTFTGDDLLESLEQNGIRRAVLLSTAYSFASPGANTAAATAAMQRENDLTARIAAASGGRLIAFCGINPIADNAGAEVRRCRAAGHSGYKLHFANSRVDLRDRAHIETMRSIFRLVDETGLPVVIHLRTEREDYGYEDAEVFIRELLPLFETSPLQIAHAAGWGGFDPATDAALSAFADALEAGGTAEERLYFDLSAVVRGVRNPDRYPDTEWWPEARYERLAMLIRRIGADRILFGTDWPEWTAEAYRMELTSELPLTEEELREIMGNTAPWIANEGL